MPELDDQRLKRILVAAAELENAEFERDRLALVCREAIKRALEAGVSPEEAAVAAGIAVVDVQRLVGAPQADEVVPLLTAAPVPPTAAPVLPVAISPAVDDGRASVEV
ncbi:hypothetical protein ACX80W_06935 [Arthrobacter sp. TMN-37]